jgi:type IV pilus assembly protein PilF
MKKPGLVLLALTLFLTLTACQQGGVRDDLGNPGSGANGGGKAEVYIKLAVAYMSAGNYGMALEKIKKGVALEPNNGNAHYVLASIYQRLGEHRFAREHFQRAIKIQPNDPDTRNAYGVFLCAQKNFEEADKQYRKALDNPLYRTPEVALTNAGTCAQSSGNKAKAEQYYRLALQRNDKIPLALLQMAQLTYDAGDPLSSREYIKRFHQVAGHTPASLWLAIKAERTLGDKNAEASYTMLLRGKFPYSPEIKLLRESKQ